MKAVLSAAALLTAAGAEVPAPGVMQLRHAIGEWQVTTEFLRPDGSVRASRPGRYRFSWVMPDRIVQGTSRIQGIPGATGILFFVRAGTEEIEMVSVGPDGRLWRMTGPADGETRTTEDVPTQNGGTMRLRFTRGNVEPDRFESRMEISTDGGRTWMPGNRQVFLRCGAAVQCEREAG